jgi:Family of unknown function (DUF6505)
VRLLRTIRLDPSDSFVFERAAQPGEWAVPGAFEFWEADPAALTGRARQAFRAGFLGLTSFGWSTLVIAVDVRPEERAEALESLAHYLMRAHGAPSIAAARAAAEEEIDYSEKLALHPADTLIAMHRTVDAEGTIREQFRTLKPADAREASQMPCSAGAFAIVEDEGAQALRPGEDIDLAALAGDVKAAKS